MSTEITVRGAAASWHPPQRATVHATISHDGAAMDSVYTQVARDLEAVSRSVEVLSEAAVTSWSAGQLRTWSSRPWHKDGKRLPPVHHAQVGLQVQFADFGALSQWVGARVAETEGFRVSTVAWELIPVHRDELLREVRVRAVADAATRAQQYADALNLGTVHPLAVADAGMLSGGAPPTGPPTTPLRAAAAGPAPDVELVPKDIELTATVDARFTAGD